MNVHSAEEVLFLISLPQHVELLLGVNILLQNVSHLFYLIVTLLQAGVVVLDLLLVLVFDFMKIAFNSFIPLVIVIFESLNLCLIFLLLGLETLLNLLVIPFLLREPVGVRSLFDLYPLLNDSFSVRPETHLVLFDLRSSHLLVSEQFVLNRPQSHLNLLPLLLHRHRSCYLIFDYLP